MKSITLALQGGGSHGAFTWGALDRLLADDRLEIEAISATSAGAINGALLACGMAAGGRDQARALLARFWWHTADMFRYSPLQATPLDRVTSNWGIQFSPLYLLGDALLRLLSPYQLNPTAINPMRPLLRSVIDYERLRQAQPVRLFISATNVRSGKVRIFAPEELTEDVVLASTCLPHLFPAVEIDGEHYWDGGFVANPAIYPLVRHAQSSEVVIIQVTPMGASELPTTAETIQNRINEISFNSSVMREMHALAFITALHDRGWIDKQARVQKTHIHIIQDEDLMRGLHSTSRFNAEHDFLEMLFHAGFAAAHGWLEAHFEDIGKGSTINVSEVYL